MGKGKKTQRNPLVQDGKWKCPCCLNFTLLEGPGYYDICPVCNWEDDMEWDPAEKSGPNHMTLAEGRRLYEERGYTADHMKNRSRKPTESEKPKGE